MSDDEPREQAEPEESPQRIQAAARLRPAALLLTAASMLNLLTGVYLLVGAVIDKRQGPNADLQQQWNTMPPMDKALFARMGWTTPDDMFFGTANVRLIYGAGAALTSLLTLAGARNMLMLRSYRLALTSAILTALPFVTPCCVLGQVAGVWAFILLMQPDVRSGFE